VQARYTKPLTGDVSYAKSRFVVQDDPKKCSGCGICIKRCPVNAITMKELKSGKKHSSTNVEECIGCGLCVLTCSKKARKMKLVRPPEYIPNFAIGLDTEGESSPVLR
jgi:NAD-dependent dihydropyrimidine dehydrogenase PreA subunit